MKRNWKKYNKSLVRHGEIMLSFDAMEQWGSTELKEMNHNKKGHRYVYPESFMEALGTAISIHICHSDKQRPDKITSKRKIKNSNVFCHLETCQQVTHQDESQTGKGHCNCN